MIRIERDLLLAAVQRVVGVIATRNTIAVLDNLLLDISDDGVTITGTDLDLHVSVSETATDAQPWRITVSAAKFAAAVSSFKPGPLVVAPVDGKSAMTVKSGRGVRTLSTLPATDFPQRAALENATRFEIAATSLVRLFDSTIGSALVETTRPYLNGSFLHVVDDHLRAAGSDGCRMVRAETAAPEGAAGMPPTIVPTKAVNLIRKLFGKHDGLIAVQVNDRAISLTAGRVTIVSKVIDGTYPDYQRIVPTAEAAHRIELVRDALVEPVTAVAAVVDAEGNMRTRAVKFELGAGEDHQVSAQDMSGASAFEPLDAAVAGGEFIFAVNHQYLVATAKLFSESATLRLGLQGPDAAMLITSDKDPDIIAVVMPMRA